jgi:hypothetical protein
VIQSIPFIKGLKHAITNCLSAFTDYITEVSDYKDAVIANSGGIIPMVLWEYHTPLEAIRHGVAVSDSFLFNGVPYGFTPAGLINLITNRSVPFLGQAGFKALSTVHYVWDGIGRYQQIGNILRRMQLRTITEVETGTGAIIPTGIEGLYQDFNGLAGALSPATPLSFPSLITDGSFIETALLWNGTNIYEVTQQYFKIGNLLIPSILFPNTNIQYLDNQWVVSIYNCVAFYDLDWVMQRYIKLEEPFYYSQTEPSKSFRNAYLGNKSIDFTVRNTHTSGLPSYMPYGRSFYSSPYVYMVYADRTVVYHVDK